MQIVTLRYTPYSSVIILSTMMPGLITSWFEVGKSEQSNC